MHLFEIIMSGNQAWKHTGIGRVGRRRDEGDAQTSDRLHSNRSQGQHMTVAATDKHQIPLQLDRSLHPTRPV